LSKECGLFAPDRQMIGTQIAAGELDAVQEREAKWLASHHR